MFYLLNWCIKYLWLVIFIVWFNQFFSFKSHYQFYCKVFYWDQPSKPIQKGCKPDFHYMDYNPHNSAYYYVILLRLSVPANDWTRVGHVTNSAVDLNCLCGYVFSCCTLYAKKKRIFVILSEKLEVCVFFFWFKHWFCKTTRSWINQT